jgi:hypothetical protein
MKKRTYIITTRDLYDVEMWPHLNERLPGGVRSLTGSETESEAQEMAADILDDYMIQGFDEMVEDGSIWVMPCFKTGYIYIKDQKEHYDEKFYKYDIELSGAFYMPVYILDRSIMNKACGYYRLLVPKRFIKKMQTNAKNGTIYNGSTGR